MTTYDKLAAVFNAPILLDLVEVELLAALAAPAHVVVDVGTGHGASAVLFALAMRAGGLVVTVDPHLQGAGEGHSVASAEAAYRNIEAALFAGALQAGIVARVMPSAQLAAQWDSQDMPIDVLFVDGDHRYEAVRQDVDVWRDHVRPGGLIVLHDSRYSEHPTHVGKPMPGPVRVANELALDTRVRACPGAHSLTVWEVL